MGVPRGIRNNNPGNLRKSADPWQGLAENQTDGEFFTFKAPVWGLRAMARTLIAYQDRHGLTTIKGIVNRWAPAEDRNDPAAYAKQVAEWTGFPIGKSLDLHTYEHLRPLVIAMIGVECGAKYRDYYPNETINEALRLAGVAAPMKPLSHSKEIIAGGGTAALGAGQIAETIESADVSELAGSAQQAAEFWTAGNIIGLVIGCLIFGAGVFVIVNRLRARAEGRR